MSTEKTGTLWGGALLIAGTTMGAGMLALPIVSGMAGFYPSLVINIASWFFMMATGLLFLEATLWLPDGANVLSISKHLLGPFGQWIGGAFFLFLYYCLMVSYLAGGSLLVHQLLDFTGDRTTGFWLFTLSFMLIVFWGAHFVDRVNGILMLGFFISFALLVFLGAGNVQKAFLAYQNWALMLPAAPVLFSAYGYHNIIPSLATYLKRNQRTLRIAIIIGTAIPFICYTLWQWIVLGVISQPMIEAARLEGLPATEMLSTLTGHPFLSTAALFFGFFALVTSLLGVALSMVDFLGDGLQVKREGFSRLLLCFLVFAPPAIFSFLRPDVFIEALGVAGGIGEAFLNGLLPIALVVSGRYILRLPSTAMIPGGRPLLFLLAIFAFLIMGFEVAHLIR